MALLLNMTLNKVRRGLFNNTTLTATVAFPSFHSLKMYSYSPLDGKLVHGKLHLSPPPPPAVCLVPPDSSLVLIYSPEGREAY